MKKNVWVILGIVLIIAVIAFGFLNSSDLILKLVNVKCPLGIWSVFSSTYLFSETISSWNESNKNLLSKNNRGSHDIFMLIHFKTIEKK